MSERKLGQEKDINGKKDQTYVREKSIREAKLQLVSFMLSNECYGIKIDKVKEVVKISKITYVPSAPDYIVGLIKWLKKLVSKESLRFQLLYLT